MTDEPSQVQPITRSSCKASRTELLEQKLKELTAKKPRAPRKPKTSDIIFDFESKAGKKVMAKLEELQDRATREAFYGELFAKGGVSEAGNESSQVQSHELASWGMTKRAGESFAKNTDSQFNVVYRWDVPLSQSALDQVVDDAGFISSFFRENEVIAGAGHDNGVAVPKQDVVVTFEGERYTYEEREQLLGKLRSRRHLH